MVDVTSYAHNYPDCNNRRNDGVAGIPFGKMGVLGNTIN